MVFIIFMLAAYFFAYAESATIAAQRVMLAHASKEGDPHAKLVEAFRSNPRRLFGTTLIGTNVCIVTLSIIGAHELLPNLGVSVVIATIIVNIVILVVSEITPKTLSLSDPTQNSLKISPYLEITAKILTPAIWVLTYLPSKVLNIDKAFHSGDVGLITESQIKHMIGLSAKKGEIERSESELALKVFKFADTIVEQVMTPCADLIHLTSGDSLRDGLKLANMTGFSRIPVLTEAGDDSIGFLAAKDLLKLDQEGRLDEPVDLYVRPLRILPDNQKILKLLGEFRISVEQIALVVDEFGTITGLVTLEDLLEEVLGEIYDEYDPEALSMELIDENLFVPGAFPANLLAERLKVDLPEGDFDTAAGLLLHLLGYMPKSGASVDLDGWTLVVTHVVRNRITRLVARRKPDGPSA